MGLKIVTQPVMEPILLEEAKLHLRITGTDDDYLIQGLIIAAREWAENFTHRKLITQTWDWTIDALPNVLWPSLYPSPAPITVPFGTLQSVTSITYIDSAGDVQSLSGSPTMYVVDIASDPGRIDMVYGSPWPTLQAVSNAVTVRIVVGYGLAAAVPRSIKLPMLLYMEALYDKDERTMEIYINAAENLLLPHRIYVMG